MSVSWEWTRGTGRDREGPGGSGEMQRDTVRCVRPGPWPETLEAAKTEETNSDAPGRQKSPSGAAPRRLVFSRALCLRLNNIQLMVRLGHLAASYRIDVCLVFSSQTPRERSHFCGLCCLRRGSLTCLLSPQVLLSGSQVAGWATWWFQVTEPGCKPRL